MLFTEGHPALGRSGQTYGADLRLTTSRFLGGPRNFDVTGYAVRSVNNGLSGRNWSYGASAHYPNDLFNAQVSLREVQENFRPALGFVQRDNIRMVRVAASFNPRPRDFLNIQQMFHDAYFTHFTSLEHKQTESWDFYLTFLDWHLRSGDNWHGMLDINPVFERLFEPFQISPGVVLPPGDYRFTRLRSNLFATATRRPLSANVSVVWGNYWSGTAQQVTTAITYRLPPSFQITFNTNQTFARLPEGHFTARIMTSNISYSASPRLSFFNLVQYDNRSRNLGWQSRVRWTLKPGNDFFIAFNQGWIHDEGDSLRFRTQDNKLSAKLQYSVRL
jgi:hypothetical protein